MVAIVSVGFVSCGDDDDDEKDGGTSIVGTWRYSYDYYGEDEGYEQYIFKRDGSGFYEDWGYENGRAELYDRMAITYSYSEKDKELVIIEDDGDVFQYTVVALTSTRLVLLEKGETEAETYVKQ